MEEAYTYPKTIKKLKTYRVTFWRSNPQLKNGGYHKIETMRGTCEENIWKRAYKKTANYGSYSPIKVEEIDDEDGEEDY